jgi:hypothetical protein
MANTDIKNNENMGSNPADAAKNRQDQNKDQSSAATKGRTGSSQTGHDEQQTQEPGTAGNRPAKESDKQSTNAMRD